MAKFYSKLIKNNSLLKIVGFLKGTIQYSNLIRLFLKIYFFLRSRIVFFYQNTICYYLASHFRLGFYPFKYIFDLLKIKFVFQVSEGTGHIISDVDYFLRLRHLDLIPKGFRYIFIRDSSHHLSKGFISVYKKYFYYSTNSSFFYNTLFPLLLAYPDLTIDCGLSRLKKSLPSKNYKGKMLTNVDLQLSKIDGYLQWLKYLSLRSLSSNYIPMSFGLFRSPDLDDYLDLRGRPLALVHIKTSVMNATAKITDEKTYIPALNFLKSKNYRLVMVGTEEMPNSFRKIGVLNYSKSSVHSFENDLKLFQRSNISLVSGSGVGWLADLMDKPIAYINFWHLSTPPYSKNCILVPALVQKKKGRFLNFKEQLDLYMNMPDIGPEIFPFNLYNARNASADEVLAAVKECIALSRKKSIKFNLLQIRYRNIDLNGYSAHIKSRISAFFVNKHKNLLN
jgi:putative glycosyltransferase (TIGR04372 family)